MGLEWNVGHKIRMWPGVFPWLMEPVGQDLESLNGVLRVTKNCRVRGVSKGNLWSVWLFFSLFSFIIRIIINCVQNKHFIAAGDGGERERKELIRIEAERPSRK